MDTFSGLSIAQVVSSLLDLTLVLAVIGGIGWFLYKKGSPSRIMK